MAQHLVQGMTSVRDFSSNRFHAFGGFFGGGALARGDAVASITN